MINQNQNLINYVKKSSSNKTEYNFLGTTVFVKDPLPEHVRLQDVFDKIEKTVPSFFFYNIDVIYIGDFKIFDQKKVNAAYADGALYVTNKQDDINDMVDDIIHELAHGLEEQYGREIYGDGKIKEEFLKKRRFLERSLRHSGFKTRGLDFMNIDYDENLDAFLLNQVGYAYINASFSGRAFMNAYSATSLREYFAVGFEKFYLGDRKRVSYMCPKLYEKLVDIDSMEE